jgi:hypothetical protein
VDVKSAGQRGYGIMFSIRELYGPALRNGAKSIIVTVNHPGGDATPTAAEKRMCEQLVKAGEQLGVPTLDMITTNGNYASIRGGMTEEGFGPADWEVLPLEKAMRVPDTATATQLMKTLRIAGGNEFAYLVTIEQVTGTSDTGRRVGAIERVPYDPATPAVFTQRLAEFAARHAGVNMIVSLPESIDVRALENNNLLIGRVRDWVKQMWSVMGINLMDVIVPDAQGNLISARTDARTTTAWAAEVNETAADTTRESAGAQGYAESDNFGGGELGAPAKAVSVADDPRYSAFTFELPELVELSRMLMGGAYPKVREQLRLLGGRALGVFRPHGGENGSPGIELLASTFNLVPPAERAVSSEMLRVNVSPERARARPLNRISRDASAV